MDDTISRQALMKEFSDFVRESNNSDFASTPTWNDAVSLVESMPSAQPETPPYVAEIESEYKKWVSMPHINKPLAKALYEVWKKHDREDVSRNG